MDTEVWRPMQHAEPIKKAHAKSRELRVLKSLLA